VASPGVEGQAAAMRKSRDLRNARDRESSETVARTLVGNVVTIPAEPRASDCSARSQRPTSSVKWKSRPVLWWIGRI